MSSYKIIPNPIRNIKFLIPSVAINIYSIRSITVRSSKIKYSITQKSSQVKIQKIPNQFIRQIYIPVSWIFNIERNSINKLVFGTKKGKNTEKGICSELFCNKFSDLYSVKCNHNPTVCTMFYIHQLRQTQNSLKITFQKLLRIIFQISKKTTGN